MMYSKNYLDYLDSPEWAEKRKQAKFRAGHKCQLCSSKHELHVHHNTYERLGNEYDTDLVVLCMVCHSMFHKYRKSHEKKLKARAERKVFTHRDWVDRSKRCRANVARAGRN